MTGRTFPIALALTLVAGLFTVVPAGAADRKPPKITKAVMKDPDGDGMANKVVLTYSEKVKHPHDKDGRYPFTVQGYKIRKISKARGKKITIFLKGSSGPARPTITYKRSRKQPVTDRAGNQAAKQKFTKVVAATVPLPEGSSRLFVNSEGPGTVLSEDGSIACQLDCSAIFETGSEVALTVVPDLEASFLGWGGACEGTSPNCVVVLGDGDTLVSATFGFPVTIQVSGEGAVRSADGLIDCPERCAGDYEAGQRLTFAATAATGSVFSGWGGACSGSEECTVTVNGPVAIQATFEPEEGETLPDPLPTLTPEPLPTISLPPL